MSKNWCYKITEGEHAGETIWSGRYCAVTAFVFCKILGMWHILANKRGKGTPDFQGYWNCPCGFLEADENAKSACSREVYEETGLEIDPSRFSFTEVETEPSKCNNGNVSLRYIAVLDQDRDNISVSMDKVLNGDGEQDEVEDIKWIPLKDVHEYKWAFSHEVELWRAFVNV